MELHQGFQSQLQRRLEMRVHANTPLSPEIVSLDLRSPSGEALPRFTAGSHIDLHLPNGLVRSYSLVNAQCEAGRYEIAIKREENGRGGSAYVHDVLRAGDSVTVSSPRNNFILEENVPHSVLFGGGIGITPLVSMALRLTELGRPFDLYYGARSRADAVFAERLMRLAGSGGSTVQLWLDDEKKGERLDLRAIADTTPAFTHFYCCGPAPMIDAFDRSLAHIPDARRHKEHFSGTAKLGQQGGFDVVLVRSGRTIRVPEGETILDTLLDEDIEVDFSCMEGFCGSCRVGVAEGIPVHRDTVLSPAERESNQVMLICCSVAKGGRIVLDL